jgi:hypothetical protein
MVTSNSLNIRLNVCISGLGFSLLRDGTPLVGNGDIGNLYLNKDMNRDNLRISD